MMSQIHDPRVSALDDQGLHETRLISSAFLESYEPEPRCLSDASPVTKASIRSKTNGENSTMTQPIIHAEHLSKVYHITNEMNGGYRTLRESIMNGVSSYFRKTRRASLTSGPSTNGNAGESRDGSRTTEFRALDDVSFEVNAGEVVGIIGRNGAGKSTLLKVLSRITEPTDGQITLQGRVGSLLEVGTGFHPELSGRENIFLNGAILGMSRKEVARKLDEIIAFAEIDKFLDMPVKRYSSGMYMRLAFAVAAHLEPEILIVDEVLAVGDEAFQKKCLGKMSQVSRQGRTVLFVSHNMSAVKALCSRVILLEHGNVALDGNVDETVERYLTGGVTQRSSGVIPENTHRVRDTDNEARLLWVRMTDLDGTEANQFYFGQPFRVTFGCEILKTISDGHFEVSLSTLDGLQVTYSTTMDKGSLNLEPGTYEVHANIDVPLLPREYTVDLGIHHQNGSTADFVQRVIDFTVLRVRSTGTDHYPWPSTRGFVMTDADWNWSKNHD